ncbi:MAG: hypothetical protein MJ072_00435 [Clostridia bacterium]|nr:hypothetical protein [Clostridia bacterium]
MATRSGRTSRNAWTDAEGYINLFASIFISNASVTGIENVRNDYILNRLFEDGKIAYHKKLKLWLPFDGSGRVDIYDEYENYTLYGANGTRINAKRDDIYIFRANPKSAPVVDFLNRIAYKLAEIDGATDQNLDAIKQMTILATDSVELTKELQLAQRKRQKNESFAVVHRTATARGEIQNLSTSAEYYVDRLQDAHDREFKKGLNFLGVYTVSEKAERRITGEIDVLNDETDAYRNIIAKTFNTDAIEQNAPFRLVLRDDGATEEEAEEEEEKTEGVENEES